MTDGLRTFGLAMGAALALAGCGRAPAPGNDRAATAASRTPERACPASRPAAGGITFWDSQFRGHFLGLVDNGFVSSQEFQGNLATLCGSTG